MKTIKKIRDYKQLSNQPKKHQQGAVLLEALIAILIFSFGLLAISGLQAAMVKNTTDSNYRAEAGYIVQQQLGRMWANPANIANILGSQDALAARLPSGTFTATREPNPNLSVNRINFVVTWQVPGEAVHNFETNASVDVNL